MDRVILHCDMNHFYANVEILHRPELRGKPVAVGGDQESRHGIILTKSPEAKKFGVATGEALWQARQKCPDLIIVPANYKLYIRYSQEARRIYEDYTTQIQPFGLDESWLDCTGSTHLFGTGEQIANTFRQRIKDELGITASVGVSWNKIFAKLGSDMKKPDATTVITRENFKETVWPLPVEDLLYVGSATKRKLHSIGVDTIGKLANIDPEIVRSRLGRWAYVLHAFANGQDQSPVSEQDVQSQIKSIGNSSTAPRDLVDETDVMMLYYVLCESVAERLRDHGFQARGVQIYVRDKDLMHFERQCKLNRSTNISGELHKAAMELFRVNYRWHKPIRSLGVRATDLIEANSGIQISLFDEPKRAQLEKLEPVIDTLRRRFGHDAISRAVMLGDRKMNGIKPKEDHTIHPVGFFRDGRLPHG